MDFNADQLIEISRSHRNILRRGNDGLEAGKHPLKVSTLPKDELVGRWGVGMETPDQKLFALLTAQEERHQPCCCQLLNVRRMQACYNSFWRLLLACDSSGG